MPKPMKLRVSPQITGIATRIPSTPPAPPRPRTRSRTLTACAGGEAESLQHSDFARAAAHRHRHCVGRNQHDGKNHRAADAQNKRLHVSQAKRRTPAERLSRSRSWSAAESCGTCRQSFCEARRHCSAESIWAAYQPACPLNHGTASSRYLALKYSAFCGGSRW